MLWRLTPLRTLLHSFNLAEELRKPCSDPRMLESKGLTIISHIVKAVLETIAGSGDTLVNAIKVLKDWRIIADENIEDLRQ